MKKKIALIYFILFIFACSHHEQHESLTQVKVSEVAKDIKIPKSIFLQLEKQITEELKLVSPAFIFLPLQVEFSQKEQSVLKDDKILFSFEKGGGLIDFKDVIEKQGSFYLSFPKEQFSETLELLHLYFISQSPIKKIDGESYGLGCGKWTELKNQFKNLQNRFFLKLNTTENRHLAVSAGHYLFVFRQANQILLSQLTLTDSRKKNELCQLNEEEK